MKRILLLLLFLVSMACSDQGHKVLHGKVFRIDDRREKYHTQLMVGVIKPNGFDAFCVIDMPFGYKINFNIGDYVSIYYLDESTIFYTNNPLDSIVRYVDVDVQPIYRK